MISATSAVAVIIPFGGTNPHRIRNLHAVLGFYENRMPDWSLVVSLQSDPAQQNALALPANVKTLSTTGGQYFSKSRCINTGVMAVNVETLLIADADLLLDPSHLQRAAVAINTGLDVVRPFQSLVDLTRQETENFMDEGALPEPEKASNGTDRYHLGEQLCLAGGAFFIRRQFFLELGGFDEEFSGWGGEDDAFSVLAESASSKTVVSRGAAAWHLWHPRSRNMRNAHYAANVQRLTTIRALDTAGRLDLAQSNRQRLERSQ